MNEAPEGLNYGPATNPHAKADMLESVLEKGKMETGGGQSYAEHEAAEMKRMLGCCSHDPMYHNSKKNR